MRIIIIGAGTIGSTLAENLIREDVDITLVDIEADLLAPLQDRLDIGTIEGVGSHPDVLSRAGADDCDLLLAVTNSDEINLAACLISHHLFHIPIKIACIRANSYLQHPELLSKGCFAIDDYICPETLVTKQICELIIHPGAKQVLNFSNEKAQLVTINLHKDNPLIGQQVQDLRKHLPNIDWRIAAIYRQGNPIIPHGNTRLESNDEIFILTASKNTDAILRTLHKQEVPYRNILIAGGGSVGARLAKNLESFCSVKIIESDPERCHIISQNLNDTLVLHGDATNTELLHEEGLDTDLFCAVTNNDAVNILSSLLARQMNTRETITLLNKTHYSDLMRRLDMGIAISPSQVTVSSILSRLRHGDVIQTHTLRRGSAEALEAIAHGEQSSSLVVGKTISDISLPPTAVIGALIRGNDVIMAHHDEIIKSNDHLILFLGDKCELPAVEKLFQVKPSFF